MSIGEHEDHLPEHYETPPPDVGDPVHYFDPEEDIPYAAIVTGTAPMRLSVDLCVLRTMGMEFLQQVPHESEAGDAHRWEWRG